VDQRRRDRGQAGALQQEIADWKKIAHGRASMIMSIQCCMEV
jgi:hypothetical protein